MAPPRLLAIAPDGWASDAAFGARLQRLAVETGATNGTTAVYLRAHGWTWPDWQHALRALPRDTGVRLGITLPVDLTLPEHVDDLAAAGVNFVHLTEIDADRALDVGLLGPLQVSRVCHQPAMARQRWQLGAHWLVVSPVFSTPSKPDVVPLGVAGLATAARAVPGRVVALGGIGADNAMECLQSGACGVAALRAAWTQPRRLASRLGMLDGTALLDDDTGA